MMEFETTETLEQIFQRSDEQDTAVQIAEQLNRSATENIHGDELKAAAKSIREELLKRLETVTDPDAQLAIARAARVHFRQICAEVSEKYAAEQRKNWEPWRVEFANWMEAGRPLDKMPLARCFSSTIKDSPSAAPETPEEEI
jgi:hypothetical protein